MSDFGNVAGNTTLDRQVIVTANQFRKGATAPTDVTIGATPTIDALRFAATNELASTLQMMPLNWNKGDVDLILIWSLADIEINGDQLSTTLDYTAPRILSTGDGIARASTQLTNNVTVTTGNGLAVGDLYSQTFTLLAADATNPLANADALALEIHLTNITGVVRADLVGACLNFEATY